jgi:hypothetical protein
VHKAADVIGGVRCSGSFESNVRYTVTLVEKDLIASCNQHRGPYDV